MSSGRRKSSIFRLLSLSADTEFDPPNTREAEHLVAPTGAVYVGRIKALEMGLALFDLDGRFIPFLRISARLTDRCLQGRVASLPHRWKGWR